MCADTSLPLARPSAVRHRAPRCHRHCFCPTFRTKNAPSQSDSMPSKCHVRRMSTLLAATSEYKGSVLALPSGRWPCVAAPKQLPEVVVSLSSQILTATPQAAAPPPLLRQAVYATLGEGRGRESVLSSDVASVYATSVAGTSHLEARPDCSLADLRKPPNSDCGFTFLIRFLNMASTECSM